MVQVLPKGCQQDIQMFQTNMLKGPHYLNLGSSYITQFSIFLSDFTCILFLHRNLYLALRSWKSLLLFATFSCVTSSVACAPQLLRRPS